MIPSLLLVGVVAGVGLAGPRRRTLAVAVCVAASALWGVGIGIADGVLSGLGAAGLAAANVAVGAAVGAVIGRVVRHGGAYPT